MNAPTLRRDDAPADRQITVRLPAHLLAKIEGERHAMCRRAPGVAFKLSDVIRALLNEAIDRR